MDAEPETHHTFQDLLRDIRKGSSRIGWFDFRLSISRYGEENQMEQLLEALRSHPDKSKIRVLQLEYGRWDGDDWARILQALDGSHNLTHIFLTHTDNKISVKELVEFIVRNDLRLECLDLDTVDVEVLQPLLPLLVRLKERNQKLQLFVGHAFGVHSDKLRLLLEAVRGTHCYVDTSRLLGDQRHLALIKSEELEERRKFISAIDEHNRTETDGWDIANTHRVRMNWDQSL